MHYSSAFAELQLHAAMHFPRSGPIVAAPRRGYNARSRSCLRKDRDVAGSLVRPARLGRFSFREFPCLPLLPTLPFSAPPIPRFSVGKLERLHAGSGRKQKFRRSTRTRARTPARSAFSRLPACITPTLSYRSSDPAHHPHRDVHRKVLTRWSTRRIFHRRNRRRFVSWKPPRLIRRFPGKRVLVYI